MGDSDETPRRPGAKRMQTSTGRDMEGLKARRDRDRVQTPARGIPVRPQMASDQIGQLAIAVEGSTVMVDAVPEEIDFDSISGVTEIMREDPNQMALVGLIAKERAHRANAILKAFGEKPPAEAMSALEKTVRRWRRVIILVAVPAVTAAAFVFRNLSEKAATEERARIELELVRDHDRDYEQRLRSLEAVTPRYLLPPGPARPDATPSRKEPSP